MFEQENLNIDITPEMLEAFKTMRSIKVIGQCCLCKTIIPLFWTEDLELEGYFLALESSFSELWCKSLPFLNSLICRRCISTGAKK